MSYSSLSPLASSSPWLLLPPNPGIYIYKNTTGLILYVGKAKNLRRRVQQYFQPPTRLGPKTTALVSQIATIEHIEVQSEIEALLLESKLIKKFQPQYNISAKDDKSPYFIHLTKEVFPQPIINHTSGQAIAGPFLSRLTASRILKQFRHIAPYCQAKRPVTKPCFYSHLGLCQPCPVFGDRMTYRKNIIRLKHLLQGKFTPLTRQLQQEMIRYSDLYQFEQANEVKARLLALNHLLSTPISPEDYIVNPNLTADLRQAAIDSLITVLKSYFSNLTSLNRIEMFDIANISGTSATAAMTVAVNGEVRSSAYRHFTIKRSFTPNDIAMMKEVLSRRLTRSDWTLPDLIILDGGKSQLSIVKNLGTNIPIIALAKREELLIIPSADTFIELKLAKNHPGLLLLEHLRDEAHRFSRRLHHKHRKNLLLDS